MKDLAAKVKAVTTVLAANLTGNGTTTKGLAVDRQGFESVLCVASVGNSADVLAAGLAITVKMLESDTTVDTDFTAVAIADMVGGSQGAAGEMALIDDPAEDSRVVIAGYIGKKRYVRVDFVRTGNHATGTPCAANVILSDARKEPDAATAAGAALT